MKAKVKPRTSKVEAAAAVRLVVDSKGDVTSVVEQATGKSIKATRVLPSHGRTLPSHGDVLSPRV